jgi:hypothetical protein
MAAAPVIAIASAAATRCLCRMTGVVNAKRIAFGFQQFSLARVRLTKYVIHAFGCQYEKRVHVFGTITKDYSHLRGQRTNFEGTNRGRQRRKADSSSGENR